MRTGAPPSDSAAPLPAAVGDAGPFDGDDEAKFASSNPVVQRLLERWVCSIRVLVGEPVGSCLDVGTGAGFALEALAIPTERLLAVEYRIGKVQAARQRVGVIHPIQGDALALPFGDASMDLVTCIEVLEHLVEPRLAVAELARVCRGACVVSVPSEPWFRLGSLARGKHLSSLGNHPEHIQQFNPRSLAQLLAAHFTDVVVERRTPWLLARAR